MKKYTLTATPRTITGRKVKTLRKQGLLPASVYGKKVKSASVSVPEDAFAKVYAQAGATGLIELSLEKDVRPVLAHHVQIDPVTHHPLHVEFFQVDLKEKVRTAVPLEIVGEAPAASQKLGVLLTILNELEVEALPAELPEKVVVDVSTLAQVDQEIAVRDLHIPGDVAVLTDNNLTVAKIGALVTKEAEAQAAEEAAAAAAQAAEEEAQAPAEGEAPAEEAPAEPTGPQEEAKAEKPEEAKQ